MFESRIGGRIHRNVLLGAVQLGSFSSLLDYQEDLKAEAMFVCL